MSGQQRFDQVMLLVNLAVTLRVVYRVVQAKRASQGRVPASVSKLLVVTASFAALYCLSYVVIFMVGPDYRLAWSHVMITVSPFVWWFVWPSLADAVTAFQADQEATHAALAPKLVAARESVQRLAERVERVA